MKRLLTLMLLMAPAAFGQSVAFGGTVSISGTATVGIEAGVGCAGAGYLYSQQLNLQKASGSDLTNFIYPLHMTLADLKTVANGGQVQNTANNALGISGPADLKFCDSASSGSSLTYECSKYDGTTGELECFVLIPTLHSWFNDSIWLFTNNSAVSTSQQDSGLGNCSSNLWVTANYKAVYHFPDGSTLNLKDSACGNDATNHSSTAGTGVLDGGIGTGSGHYANVPKVSGLNLTSAFTLEGWAMPTNLTDQTTSMIADDYVADSNVQYELSPFFFLGDSGVGTQFGFYNGSWHSIKSTGNGYTLAYVWERVTGVWNGTTLNLFSNGVSVAPAVTPGSSPPSSTSDVFIGKRHDNTQPQNAFPGLMDELRIASDAKTTNWEVTNYSAQAVMSYTQFQTPNLSLSAPTAVNITSCSSDSNPVCVLPFPVTSGGTIVAVVSRIIVGGGLACPSMSNDSAGNVYTAISGASGGYSGTLRDYYSCIYQAPITATGSVTVTLPSGDSASAMVFEVKKSTTTGAVGAGAGNNTQPHTMTATCPTSTCLLICTTVGDTTNVTNSTTPSYPMMMSTTQPGDHEARTYIGIGLVSSGSRSCEFNAAPTSPTGGPSGALALIPYAP